MAIRTCYTKAGTRLASLMEEFAENREGNIDRFAIGPMSMQGIFLASQDPPQAFFGRIPLLYQAIFEKERRKTGQIGIAGRAFFKVFEDI